MILKDINKAILVWGPISKQRLALLKEEKPLVIVPENRPYMIGIRHNIPILKKENIKFVYCNDNAMGLLFYKGKIAKTLVFVKEDKQQNIVGISGTNYVTILSRIHNVPVVTFNQDKAAFNLYIYDVSSLGEKSLITIENKTDVIIPPQDEVLLLT